jgi:hypothetical protein
MKRYKLDMPMSFGEVEDCRMLEDPEGEWYKREDVINFVNRIPTGEYVQAQVEGCSANVAWDCFCDKLDEYINEHLGDGE